MRHDLKRDWEIVRIFLILAILTAGFVWGVQSLLLAPMPTPHLQSYGLSAGDRGVVIMGKLNLYPESLITNQKAPEAPLHQPAPAAP